MNSENHIALAKSLKIKTKVLFVLLSIILFFQLYGLLFIDINNYVKADFGNKLFMVPLLISFVMLDEIFGINYFNKIISNKKKFPPHLSWILVLAEVCVPSIILLYLCIVTETSGTLKYYDVFNSPPVLMYFIILLLSSLHQNFKLSIIAGVFATAQYIFLVVYFMDFTGGELNFQLSITKGAFILASGVSAAFVAKLIKNYISETLQTKDVLINTLDEKVKERTIELAEANEELHQTNEELATQRDEIENQKNKIEEVHKEIQDSIVYAKRIQTAILPASSLIKELLPDSFVLYQPKDVVAGDFYWLEKIDDKVLFAAADCTGHGVPGAMISVVCNNALNRTVKEFGLLEPGKILDKTRELVLQELSKSEDGLPDSTEGVKDGMDIAICVLRSEGGIQKLEYAGAHNPLWIIRNGELLEIKADKQPIGKFENPRNYTTHKLDLITGDVIYIFSDGYADQFGGTRDKKFGTKNFKELLLSIQDKNMSDQNEILGNKLISWMKEAGEEQLDDVCVIGVRI